ELGAPSASHLHTFPKGHVIGDVLGRFQRRGVVPSRVFVHSAIDDDVIVAGRPLPRANGVGRTRFKILLPDRVGRKVMIAFHEDRFLRLGQDGVIPDRAYHQRTSRERVRNFRGTNRLAQGLTHTLSYWDRSLEPRHRYLLPGKRRVVSRVVQAKRLPT